MHTHTHTPARAQSALKSITLTNAAGDTVAVTSDGAINDHTPPVLAYIDNGGPYVTGAPTTFEATWRFTDLETGVASYVVQLLVEEDDGSMSPASLAYDMGTAYTAVLDADSVLVPGRKYYVHVTATNGAGLAVSATSAALLVDNDAPTCAWMIDGEGSQPSDDINVHIADTFLRSCWSCSDPNGGSGIQSFDVRLMHDSNGWTEVFAETVPSALGQAQCSSALGVHVATGSGQFRFELVATDGVGLTSTGVQTDGLIVDLTPAVRTTVVHGVPNGATIEYAADNTSFNVHFDQWTEDVGVVEGYEVAFGSGVGLDDYVPRTSVVVPASPSDPVHFTGVPAAGSLPVDGAFVFASVWRVGGVKFPGADQFAVSPGLVVDLSPPTFSALLNGDLTWGVSPGTQASGSSISADVTVPLRGVLEPQSHAPLRFLSFLDWIHLPQRQV